MGRCSRCDCQEFEWDPSAVIGVGFRICKCGHHYNYHGLKRKEEVKKESSIETNTQ